MNRGRMLPLEVVRPVLAELVEEAGSTALLAHQVSADGRMTYETADRRLRQWLHPSPVNNSHGRRMPQTTVSAVTLDVVLSALDRTDLWHRGPLAEVVGDD